MGILGVDLGWKRVGVAVRDEMGWTGEGIERIKMEEGGGE